MLGRTVVLIIACLGLAACATDHPAPTNRISAPGGSAMVRAPDEAARVSAPELLVIGESFSIDSRIMGEMRRMNVFVPSVYGQKFDVPLPVLYMLDGGLDEDFLHIAGLVQVLVCNGGMRPFMVVGIQNTSRRRDMTGPTTNEEDKKIAPVVGGSATFRRFIKEELIPTVRARYRTNEETAIVGESAAGLFVLETFFLEPDLFNSYIAIDPSLWWANEELVNVAPTRLRKAPFHPTSLFVASSSEPGMLRLTGQLAGIFESHRTEGVAFRYVPLPTETHATIYHPAALLAFRTVFAPPAADPK